MKKKDRRFFRTVCGKAMLFAACLLAAAGAAASLCGAVAFADDGTFYSQSRDEAVRRLAVNPVTDQYAYPVLTHTLNGEEWRNAGIRYGVYDETGKAIAVTGGGDAWMYEEEFGVLTGSGGKVTDVFPHSPESAYDRGAVSYYTVGISWDAESGLGRNVARRTALVNVAYSMRYAVYAVLLVSFLGAAAAFIALMTVSGRRPGDEGLHPGPLHRVPYDLMLAGSGFLFTGALWGIAELQDGGLILLAPMAVVGFAAASVVLGMCMSTAVRLKDRSLLKNTVSFRLMKLLCRAVRFLYRFIRQIPLVWKTALAVTAAALFEIVLASAARWWDEELFLFSMLLEKAAVAAVLLYAAVCMKRLRESAGALARGDLTHVTDTTGMLWELRRHGEDLNRISGGMSAAVEERMKSERMKTQLITNVSHDIKTPLTSVISYASLIGEEKCENERITEYAGVLVRQSAKLKRLIEDLVEASKASSGDLDVQPVPCEAAVFLTQAAGEYEDRLAAAGLTPVMRLPDEKLTILADGRRMWRIFDNLMSNVCKYAQAGTRVYLTLERQGSDAAFVFRNISRDELNVTAAELAERFVRGDASRHTEGSGLGLSIARSMAELQGGTLSLDVDGDLFKASLTFPLLLAPVPAAREGKDGTA